MTMKQRIAFEPYKRDWRMLLDNRRVAVISDRCILEELQEYLATLTLAPKWRDAVADPPSTDRDVLCRNMSTGRYFVGSCDGVCWCDEECTYVSITEWMELPC